MALAAGTRFGPYEISGPLGAGGSSIVVVRNWAEDLKRRVPTKSR